MSPRRRSSPPAVADALAEVVERVFATVATLHRAALEPAAREGFSTGGTVLDPRTSDLLHEPGQLAVGLGLVAAPRAGRPLRLEWWQLDTDGGRVRVLDPDLRPDSMGYYDYTTTEWFDVPRRTGRRHVVGPYVDVHGTGRYLLTFTEPVLVDGDFVGVVGADVPVHRFETHLLEVLGASPGSFVLLNEEDRVVMSTAPQRLVGELVDAGPAPSGEAAAVAGTPWRLLPVAARSVLTG